MSTDMLFVILLVWAVAGVLAAVAFGKSIQETSPEEEESLASSTGTVKYFRKNKTTPHGSPSTARNSRHGSKHASG